MFAPAVFSLLFLHGCLADYTFKDSSLDWDKKVDDLLDRMTLDEVQEQLSHVCTLPFLHGCLADYPFRDSSLDWNKRVDDLVDRMTLDEVQTQLSHGAGQAPPLSRLGIKDYAWWTNCARGDVGQNATGFPQAIGLGASFDKDLVYQIGEASSTEVRAYFNHFRDIHSRLGVHKALSCFSPNVDTYRDPRWGRGEETFGEDPYVAGEMGYNLVKGLHGNHPRYLRTSTGCKHFAVSGGPETGRLHFDTKVSEHDLRTYFLPPFRRCVEAGAYSLICSYNKINGVPACANKMLLTDILRGEWNFQGYIIADYGEIYNIIHAKHYYSNDMDAAVGCLKAGCNIECEGKHPKIYDNIVQAVHQGKLTEKFVRDQIRPLWYTRMRLGEFDPVNMNPYNKLDRYRDVLTTNHINLAELAAQRTFTLFKNEHNYLPIRNKLNKIAVVGPLIDDGPELFGDYAPKTDQRLVETPLDGLKRMAVHVNQAEGCSDVDCKNYNKNAVMGALNGVNAVFVVLGTGTSGEHEGHDRTTINLPGHQLDLLKDVVNHVTGGAGIIGKRAGSIPVVLLLVNGGPLEISWAMENPGVTAIMDLFLPAQRTGSALHDILTNSGPNSVPAGRSPYTWPTSDHQIPPITDYTMQGRTYWYFKGEPTIPFGYGLSYTKFSYTSFHHDSSVQAGNRLSGSVTINNIGSVDADEVVQVYISWQDNSLQVPKLQLVAYDRVHINHGGHTTWQFHVEAKNMAIYDTNVGWKIVPGKMNIYIGGQQPNQKLNVGSNVENGVFTIQGSKTLGKY